MEQFSMKFKDLTLQEKCQILTGSREAWCTEDLGGKVPYCRMQDGPSGLMVQGSVSVPCLQNIGNSWSEDAAYLMASIMAEDCIEHEVDVLLAPGVNIKRNNVCGRNFEYVSEDPYLSGILGKHFVNGLQDKGIGATVKHLCANNREYARFTVSSEVDERALHEIYLEPFRIVLESKPWIVMCSYNPLNGWYTSENRPLLKGILRDTFGFDGLIVSDWCAVHDRAKSLKATLDLEMPFAERSEKNLLDAHTRGFITTEEIDESVQRMQDLMDKVEASKAIRPTPRPRQERHNDAIKVAEEGIVLLKNEDGVLPLKNPKRLAVIGQQARYPEVGGGGSSDMSAKHGYDIPFLDRLLKQEYPDCSVRFIGAYKILPHLGFNNREWLEKIAIRDAYESEYSIVCVGDNRVLESEGYDRQSLKLPLVHENLVKHICEVNPNVIVIVTAGSAIDMTAWIDKAKAVIYTSFGGEGINEALCNIITGKTCPSGKLSETFVRSIEDNPINFETGNGFVERYNDGIMVGYKYYEKNNIPVLFPFGYGKSYATFEYSDLKIEKLGDADYNVSYTVTNTSDVDGKEISQLYIKDVFSMVEQPPKALKGFAKTFLKAGESKVITHRLDKQSFSYYSTMLKEWFLEDGWFEIYVGASSADIRLQAKLLVKTDEDQQNSKYDEFYNLPDSTNDTFIV